MAGGIIELADQLLQSKAAKLDPDLMQTLRTCLRRNLTLVITGIPEQVEPDRAPAADSNPPDKLLTITSPDPDIQATCNPPPPSNHGALGEHNYNPPVQNVLGNGWMGHFPLPNGGASVGGTRHNSQPDSLSISIIHFAMRRAYFALVTAGSPAHSLALWAFKSSLQQRSREEVLLNLRWVLGPGHATLHQLAKRPLEALDAPKNVPTLHPLVDDAAMQSFKDLYPQETEPFLSAQDVQELLVYNGLRYIDNDVLELFIQIDADGRWVMPFPEVRPIRQPSDFLNPHVFFPSSRATTRSQGGGVGSRPPRMIHIYISQSTFLYHLSSYTVCLAHGPAFVRACVQQVIKASLIDLEVG